MPGYTNTGAVALLAGGSSMSVKLFNNPLDPTGTPSGLNGTNPTTGFAVNATLLPSAATYGGTFVTLESGIPDGASNTVMLTEKYSGANGANPPAPNWWWNIYVAPTGTFGVQSWSPNWSTPYIFYGSPNIELTTTGAAFGYMSQIQFAPTPSAAVSNNNVQSGQAKGILLGMADGTVRTLTQTSYNANGGAAVGPNQVPVGVWTLLVNPSDNMELPGNW